MSALDQHQFVAFNDDGAYADKRLLGILSRFCHDQP
jgi:hypothetical protein